MRERIKGKASRKIIQISIYQYLIPNTSKEISYSGLAGPYLPLNARGHMCSKFDVRYILLGPREGLNSQNNNLEISEIKK